MKYQINSALRNLDGGYKPIWYKFIVRHQGPKAGRRDAR